MSHPVPGRRPVEESLRAGRDLLEVVVADRGAPVELADAARAAGVRVRQAPVAELDALAEGVRHQGVVALAARPPFMPLDALATCDLVVVVDHVTDPQNLGAIARSAELAGAGALVVPRRRSAPVGPAAEKAAAGAFAWLSVIEVANTARGLAALGERGLWSVGLDGDAPTRVFDEPLLDEPVAIVIGAEGHGLSRLVAERCDALVAIPQRGRTGALNASAAAAVALFEVVRRRGARVRSDNQAAFA